MQRLFLETTQRMYDGDPLFNSSWSVRGDVQPRLNSQKVDIRKGWCWLFSGSLSFPSVRAPPMPQDLGLQSSLGAVESQEIERPHILPHSLCYCDRPLMLGSSHASVSNCTTLPPGRRRAELQRPGKRHPKHLKYLPFKFGHGAGYSLRLFGHLAPWSGSTDCKSDCASIQVVAFPKKASKLSSSCSDGCLSCCCGIVEGWLTCLCCQEHTAPKHMRPLWGPWHLLYLKVEAPHSKNTPTSDSCTAVL